MTRPTRILAAVAAAAVAVPLVPWLLWGGRIDAAVTAWLEPPPAPPALAAAVICLLAADILLPVPSSMVAALGGAGLGVVGGTASAWLGLTVGSLAGWWLGRTWGGGRLAGLDAATRCGLEERLPRYGPLVVVLSRPLPILAEAVALLAGAGGMSGGRFATAAGAANLAIAFAWSLAGAVGHASGTLAWMLLVALAVPAAAAALVCRRVAAR